MMKHKNISIVFISLLIIAILLMMSPRMLAYTIPAVENLKVEYTDGTANLSWSSVTNADGYEVFVNIPGYGYANIGSVSENKVSVIGISEDTAYSVKVRAYEYVNNIKEVGNFSNEVDFDTNKEADLDRVTGVKVETTGNIAKVEWNAVSEATGYEVYVDIPNYGFLKIGNATTNSAVLMGFQTNGKYAVKIRAFKGTNGKDGYGEFSSSKTFYINSEDLDDDKKEELDQVKDLEYNLEKDKVYLNWSKVKDADKYEIYLSKNGKAYSLAGTVTKNSATISDLDYNTSYKVKVRAYNEKYDEYGAYSDIESFKTEKYNSSINNEEVGKVKNVNASVTGSTVYLSWKSVPGAVKYEIQFTVPGYGGATSIWSEGPGRTISGLTNKTSNYTARVRAYKYVDGRLVPGEYSDVVRFKGK